MRRRLFPMVLALVLAAIGTALVFAYVQGADRRALAGHRAVDALVAAKAIPAGTPASDLRRNGWVRSVRMPASAVPDDLVTTIDGGLEDLVVGSAIGLGHLIRKPLLVPRGRSQGFAVPEGKLALTVALTDPQRVAGYVTAGSEVAVFVATKLLDSRGKPLGEATGARMLMADIEVLSIGPAKAKEKDAASVDPQTLVTVAVTQREAEKLVWATGAQQSGRGNALYLALQTDSTRLDTNSPGVSSFTFAK
ncbi:Flp pilus assembly protein CpaB [Thermomonospora umbrina]|uniref:Pilus assembly protein CpaB n=1 Tax=Thermomonospora umbrina TaxID=111806 RepID=A0A3D9SS69_9ACTN|nr:RcpC/CpaB family pilus assembly protein [Thermomonospora umbrina]REE96813.1 pilus assembly protein CpaB [Thermomonospora umbrina]